MSEQNTPGSGEQPNEGERVAGDPPIEPELASGQLDKPRGPLTPGQRLAAKKAQKAVEKREAREERLRSEEEVRLKEQEEADKLFGRGPVEPALPAEVERAASGFTDFMQANRGRLVGGVVLVLVGVLAAIGVRHFMRSGAAEQAQKLTQALETANAAIDADDTDGKTDEGKPVFKNEQERATKALAAFDQVAREGEGPTVTWANLAGGAALVQLGKFEDAQKRYQSLYDANSKQPEVAAVALEGSGIALEGAGKLDEAQKRFEQLAKLEGHKDLAEYHLARLKLQKGDVEGGKTLLKGLYDRLSAPAEGTPPSRYLRSEVEVRLAEIDSSLVDKASGGGGQQQFSEEQIQRMIEQLQRQQQGQGGAGAE
jgi:hypothetical protein